MSNRANRPNFIITLEEQQFKELLLLFGKIYYCRILELTAQLTKLKEQHDLQEKRITVLERQKSLLWQISDELESTEERLRKPIQDLFKKVDSKKNPK